MMNNKWLQNITEPSISHPTNSCITDLVVLNEDLGQPSWIAIFH